MSASASSSSVTSAAAAAAFPLHRAVSTCNIAVVQEVLDAFSAQEKSELLNAFDDEFGLTPAMFACIYDAPEILALLLNHGALVDVHSKDQAGPALFYAMSNGSNNTKCARLLLEFHANPNTTIFSGSLHYVQFLCGLSFLPRNIDLLRLLFDFGANFLVRDACGNTCLHLAVRQGNVGIVEFLKEMAVIDPNETNERGETALHTCLRLEEILSYSASFGRQDHLNMLNVLVTDDISLFLISPENAETLLFKLHSCMFVGLLLDDGAFEETPAHALISLLNKVDECMSCNDCADRIHEELGLKLDELQEINSAFFDDHEKSLASDSETTITDPMDVNNNDDDDYGSVPAASAASHSALLSKIVHWWYHV